jgi:sugar lactone lactonase YvrE
MRTTFFKRALRISTVVLSAATTLNAADLLYVISQNVATPIYIYNSAGVQSVFAPEVPAPRTRQIAFDAGGNLFAANQDNNAVYRFDPSGAMTIFADSGLSWPYGLAFGDSGNLFVSNRGNNTIEQFSPDGTGTVFANLDVQPMSLGYHGGSLYCVDIAGEIERFDGAGTASLITQLGTGGAFGGIVFDHSGNLFTANNMYLYKVTPDGVASVFFDFSSDPFTALHGVAIDSSDNLFVSDLQNTIWKIAPDGNRIVFANQVSPAFMAVEVVPEPSAITLLFFGITAFAGRFRRFHR